jgi:hypothetical protein
MGVGDKNVSVDGAFFQVMRYEMIAQEPYSGAEIHDDKPVAGPDLQTGSVSAKDNRFFSRAGDTAPNAPKSYR